MLGVRKASIPVCIKSTSCCVTPSVPVNQTALGAPWLLCTRPLCGCATKKKEEKKREVTSQVPFITFDSIARSLRGRGGRPRPAGCDVAWSANYPAHSSCHSGSVGCQSSCFFKYCEMEQEPEPDSNVNQSVINISAAVHALVSHAPVGQLTRNDMELL